MTKASVTYFIKRHGFVEDERGGRGESVAEGAQDAGHPRNMFALHYIPHYDPVIITNVLLVVIFKQSHFNLESLLLLLLFSAHYIFPDTFHKEKGGIKLNICLGDKLSLKNR